MSSNGPAPADDQNSVLINSLGIRLPPISFLSRDNQNQQLLASMLPIAQKPLGKLHVPTLPTREQIPGYSDTVLAKNGTLPPAGDNGVNIYRASPQDPQLSSETDVSGQHPPQPDLKSSLGLLRYTASTNNPDPNLKTDSLSENGYQPSQDGVAQKSQYQAGQKQYNINSDDQINLSNKGHHHHQHHPHPYLVDRQLVGHADAFSAHAIEHVSNGVSKAQDVPSFEKPALKMDREKFYRQINKLSPRRRHLGTIMYNPTTTWSTLQIEKLHGLEPDDKSRLLEIQRAYSRRNSQKYSMEEQAYIPVIPPLPECYVNCFLDVKIPYKFIKEHLNLMVTGKIRSRRELWGGMGDIYTDDSDLLSVLSHLGLFNDALDLSGTNPSWTSKDMVKPLNIQYDEDGLELLDLSVTLLLLPPLLQYHGFYRNEIHSRSWVGHSPHDGLSFGVYSAKWETCLVSVDERNLYKWAQKENAADIAYEKSLLSSGAGWKFDGGIYQQLKEKYSTD